MTDPMYNPNPKPNSNIDDVIDNVIFSDGQILTKTKNNENDNYNDNRLAPPGEYVYISLLPTHTQWNGEGELRWPVL